MHLDGQPQSQHGAVKLWLLAILVGLGALAAFWYHQRSNAAEASKDAPAEAVVLQLADSDVLTVQSRAITRTLPLSGTLLPLERALIKAKVSGQVLKIAGRSGDAVAVGSTLVKLDTHSQMAVVASQNAAIAKAQADFSSAQLNHSSNQRLFEKGFIAKIVLDTSKANADAARAGVTLAQAQARLAAISLDDAVIRAPFAGIIARRMVEVGEQVGVGSELLELVNLTHLQMQAAMPAVDIPSVRLGQAVTLKVDGFGQEAFSGRVSRINPTTEAGTRSVMVFVDLENADGRIKGGMYAQGQVTLMQAADALVIPQTAVRMRGEQAEVLMLVGQTLQTQAISLGARSDDGWVAVATGLTAGTHILAVGAGDLKAGTRVQWSAGKSTDAKIGK